MVFMKYYLKKLNKFPFEIIDIIYSYISLVKIEKKNIWFNRLISPDYKYYSELNINYRLNREKVLLDLLLNQKAYHIIDDIHKNNLEIL